VASLLETIPFLVDVYPTFTYTMGMMNNETIDAILQHEGYEIREGLELFDTVGQFVDQTFKTRKELNAYVEKHIAPHAECSEMARGWGL